jgi:NADH:ubiquinone oxidoreductase subunit
MFDLTSILTMFDSFQIRLFTWRKGVLVGTDSSGNRYYRARRVRAGRPERRWVIYRGSYDASKVPPEWFGWLHHTDSAPLPADSAFHKSWIKPHVANPTGTAQAYRPPGHPLSGGQRRRVSGDYEPWQPA